jgi:hypothetical protein
LNEQSERAADASTVLSLTGLACITTSVLLLLTAKESARAAQPERASATFTFSRAGSTLGVSGRF